MNNNEKKSNEKWSLKKTILFIVLVVLLFATMFSCGLNTFKTTYNQVNQVNYEEKNDLLTDYTSFNKIDRGINKLNNVIGTSVPNTGNLSGLYLNTLLTQDEITDIIINANLDFNNPMGIYVVVATANNLQESIIIQYFASSNSYGISFGNGIGNGNQPIYSSTDSSLWGAITSELPSNINFVDLLSYLSNPLLSTFELIDSSIQVGLQNSSLTQLFSSSPFEIESGGTYTPNPQYNIVQPSINGDLVLGTLIEPNLESQTTFSELYVSYIIGASDYSYSLNMVINLVLEGVNNYINVPISTTLNMNDLSNSSYTQVIANFDTELEELSLVIEVYSNNSVIYTYDNSFSCVINNSITYPYQVSGFSNTPTAKQYLSSYNSTQGYNNGFNLGKQEGLTQGYNNGYSEGLNQGSEQGYNNGYNEGKSDGYSQGYHDGSNNEFAKDGVKDLVNIIFNAPYNIFNGFLNFEIFGVNLFNLLSFIFTLTLVGWIIALLMKR